VDVGGTFTKAVAVDPARPAVVAQAVLPTTQSAPNGVAEGVAAVIDALLRELGPRRGDVELVAFSTTQAMNALLEGDAVRVGIVGLASEPDVRIARKRTRVGRVALAPGRALETVHEFVETTHGLEEVAVDAALERLAVAGCRSVAVSGAFSVDGPEHEQRVAERARAQGFAACGGHELTGAYGLETRTVSAAINASVLPIVDVTAAVVEQALADAGLDVPLLVLRGDGGAMGTGAFRRQPSLTIGSGPAAGVAAALHQLELRDALVVECGGTSSNVSVVKGSRPVLRTVKVMGRPTSIRAIDSWVVGVAGGSLARLRRRRLAEAGPRSAHIADLRYACFASPVELEGGRLEVAAPREGDPEAYAVVEADGRRFALTPTCAAYALGILSDDEQGDGGSGAAALSGFALLADVLGDSAENAARRLHDAAVEKLCGAIGEAARFHELGREVPLVGLGGAADVLVPAAAERLGRPLVLPEHREVLSSVGAALSLVRAEATRTATPDTDRFAVAREAEHSCIEAGAAPSTVVVETHYDAADSIVRAVATGAAALETGAARRAPADEAARRGAAAAALGLDDASLTLLARTEFYGVYSENGAGRFAVVDGVGAVALAEEARRLLAGEGPTLMEDLTEALRRSSIHVGVATLLPRVIVVCGPRILDLSDARRADEILHATDRALSEHGGPAIAAITR
jgi:N-methylhydantoinase A/oxoprolinase/acetone carboxylase beta subunit